jgi:hypothetical protein
VRKAPIISQILLSFSLSLRSSIRPSLRQSACISAAATQKDFLEIWYWGTCIETCRQKQNFVKSGQKYRVDYMKTSVCSVSDDTKALLCNIRYFYIVDNVISSTAQQIAPLNFHCNNGYISRHIVTLYVQHLSCVNRAGVCLLRGTNWIFWNEVWRLCAVVCRWCRQLGGVCNSGYS